MSLRFLRKARIVQKVNEWHYCSKERVNAYKHKWYISAFTLLNLFFINLKLSPLACSKHTVKIGGTKTKRQFTLGSFHKPLVHDTKRDLQNAVIAVAFIHNCFSDKCLFWPLLHCWKQAVFSWLLLFFVAEKVWVLTVDSHTPWFIFNVLYRKSSLSGWQTL